MLEAKLERAELLKKILDAVKELVTDANWDCSDEGMKLQAMDNSHIALVSLDLQPSSFMDDAFRCDRNMSLGMNLGSLQKIIKCASNDDEVTLRADDDSDLLGLTFQNRRQDRMGEYEMKLMDIDQEHLGIPDTQYDAQVTMPSSEFLRIVRDIKELGESVKIEVTKEGVKFSSEGDIGTAAVTLRPTTATTGKADSDSDSDSEESSDEEDDDDEEEEEEEEAEVKSEPDEDAAPKKKAASKKKVVADSDDDDDNGGDDEMNGNKENGKDAEGTQEDRKPVIDFSQDDDEEDENEGSSKRKRAGSQESDVKPDVKKSKKGKKAAASKKEKKQKKKAPKAKGKVIKKSKKRDSDEPNRDVVIALTQSVSLTFSIKYLLNFAKSTPLSDTVSLHLSAEVPLLVQYEFTGGSIRFYLAPKISDE